jgi:GNAT superfamily N-acetyltransferase
MTDHRVAIRPAEGRDAEKIAEIWHLGWHDAHDGHVPSELVEIRTEASFLDRAPRRISDATVATVDGDVAGFVMVVDDEVEQMYVSAAARGTGVADGLMQEAERQVRESGHAKAWLAVVAGNARARRFYERAGWVDEGSFDYAAAVDAASETGTIAVPCRRYTKAL